jgi:hypothetical protein
MGLDNDHLNLYQMNIMVVSHAIFQTWETVLETIAFRQVLKTHFVSALGLETAINLAFILLRRYLSAESKRESR